MPSFDYMTVDVFTSSRFGGNPLAVIPDARGLDPALMQRLAVEFNYSEITFVLPPRDPAHTARVRIFTPTAEIPFAGHPNVGTAFLLGRQGVLFDRPVGDVMHFEEDAGLVEVTVLRETDAIVGARIVAPGALEVGDRIAPKVVASCASLSAEHITTVHHPPVMASVGLPFVLAEVTDLAALGRARPNGNAFVETDTRMPRPEGHLSLFLYARVPSSNGVPRVRARMFAPLDDIQEDPATGSASAALGAYLASLRPEPDLDTHLVIEQGVEMGRPSTIEVHVRKSAGAVRHVAISGRCIPVMVGRIEI
ncbi:PhzF family phenazine biosynthesis protein [Chondromyces crocatus]|uniref:Phenazine biosynthesis protein PhzF n=1 Tax=Chondromyces crocatus TaxID=52 RepID=A0A0K1E7L2_CHOCO|nr:PhzF family phenazine biosynthesis protein [Chondromyces crocatus]AKT36662.1 phenazine biosynthesis protein PhzF [Chondromyces crocatus]